MVTKLVFRGAQRVVTNVAARARVASMSAADVALRGVHGHATMAHVAGEPTKHVLHERHMPTSPTQKILLSVITAVTVLANPERADMLAALGEVTGGEALKHIHARMCSDPVGTRILVEQPTIRSDQIDIAYLRALPKDTFGYAYATFMDGNGFDADGRAYVQFVDDPELAYVMRRYRELHDFWHTLFGLPSSIFGEVVLKYIELVQTGLPVCALGGLLGPVHLSAHEKKRLVTEYIPYALRAGQNAHFLMNVYYEKEFETPLAELRKRLRIEVAPPV